MQINKAATLDNTNKTANKHILANTQSTDKTCTVYNLKYNTCNKNY